MAGMLGLERFGFGFAFIENLLVFVLKKRNFFFVRVREVGVILKPAITISTDINTPQRS